MCAASVAEADQPATTLAEFLTKQLQGGGKKGSSNGSSTPSSNVQMHGGATLLGSHQAMSDPTKLRELEDKIETLTSKLANAEAAQREAEAARSKEEAARTGAEERERQLQVRLSDSEKEVVRLQASLDQANKARSNEGDLRHQSAMWSSLLMTQMNVDTAKFSQLMAAQRQVGSSAEEKEV